MLTCCPIERDSARACLHPTFGKTSQCSCPHLHPITWQAMALSSTRSSIAVLVAALEGADEFPEVDLAVSVQIRLLDHLADLLRRDADVRQAIAQLVLAEGAAAVGVQAREQGLQLGHGGLGGQEATLAEGPRDEARDALRIVRMCFDRPLLAATGRETLRDVVDGRADGDVVRRLDRVLLKLRDEAELVDGVRLSEGVGEHDEEVDERPDSEAADRQGLQRSRDVRTDEATVETANPEEGRQQHEQGLVDLGHVRSVRLREAELVLDLLLHERHEAPATIHRFRCVHDVQEGQGVREVGRVLDRNRHSKLCRQQACHGAQN
mmetsp:Transcript_98800/g.308343  ORF Transcript_98800/g.308343 Transcript_98800/m.308343 type:complete len:322 (-) Transcript_98800:73-1038(-)